MSKVFESLLVLSVLSLFLPYIAMADSHMDEAREKLQYSDKVGIKLGNGIANAVGGFMEIPKNVIIITRNKGPVYGASVGLMVGIMHTLGRTVYGAIDIATFLIPTKPLIEPNYIWNDFDKITTYKPTVQMQ